MANWIKMRVGLELHPVVARLTTVCACNSRKGRKTMTEFMEASTRA